MINRSTLIIGSGKHAFLAADTLAQCDVNVFLCSKDKVSEALTLKESDNLHLYENTRIVYSKGCIGDFHIRLNTNGMEKDLCVSTILIAENSVRLPSYESYGIHPSSFVMPLSDALEILSKTDTQKTAAFLTGISYESHPIILEEVMHTAIAFQKKHNSQAYIFTGNLKVAQNGLEAMYRTSRKLGIMYVKSSQSHPKIEQNQNGTISILFFDDMSCEWFRIAPDLTIVDEVILPDEYLSHLSSVFGLDTDTSGFLQTENVHRTPLFTNARGILVAGPSRRIQSEKDHLSDLDIACAEILSMFEQKSHQTVHTAEIIKGSCIHCLTCYRVCPYQAISLNTLPAVMPDACEGCGICASQCPRQAITIEHLSVRDISEQTALRPTSKSKKTFSPHIIAFCCARSAVLAYKHACMAGYTLPKGMKVVNVPCGGAISLEHILSALTSGADGVMMVTCHEGNCHAERGNQYARSNANRVIDFLLHAGIQKGRVKFMTIASNMGVAFAESSIAFNKDIISLGPGRSIND